MIMAAYISTGQMDITVDGMNIDADDLQPTADAMIAPIQKDRISLRLIVTPMRASPTRRSGAAFGLLVQSSGRPTITLWQPPDASQKYMLNYYRARQLQDASPARMGCMPRCRSVS